MPAGYAPRRTFDQAPREGLLSGDLPFSNNILRVSASMLLVNLTGARTVLASNAHSDQLAGQRIFTPFCHTSVFGAVAAGSRPTGTTTLLPLWLRHRLRSGECASSQRAERSCTRASVWQDSTEVSALALLANRGGFLVTVEMLDVHFTVNSMHRPPLLPTPRSYGEIWSPSWPCSK